MEAEDLDRRDQVAQPVVDEGAAVMAHQAVVHHLQVRLEGGGAGVGFGLHGRAPRRRRAGQARQGGGQAGVDAGQGAAIGFVGALGRRIVGGLGQGRQLRRHLGQFGRQAQLGAQGVDLLQIEAQHRLGLGMEGGLQHRGVDVGIAVAVAADPGADAQEGLQVGRLQQPAPVGQLARRHAQEDAVQEGDDGVDLVLHHQALAAHQPRGPQDGDLAAQRLVDDLRRAGGPRPVAGVQHLADGGGAVDHALAPHLRWVGGQDRRDQRLIQQGAHGRAVHALVGQPLQRALGRVGAHPGLGLVLCAPTGRAVLGDVGQEREQGEAVRQARRFVH